MDLRGCLEPALFGLFPIRQAASAGPQPAREWKSLAHVIFGKCRVHRNPGARSPVSARRPMLTFTKEGWRHCAAAERRWVQVSSRKLDNSCNALKGLSSLLCGCSSGSLSTIVVYWGFFLDIRSKPQSCLRLKRHGQHCLTLRASWSSNMVQGWTLLLADTMWVFFLSWKSRGNVGQRAPYV